MYATLLVGSAIVAFFKSIVELLDVEVFHLSFRFVFCSAYLALIIYLFSVLLKMLGDQLVAIRDGENIVESVVHLRVRHYVPNFSSPYDKGVFGNWKNLMGDDPLQWFLPIPHKATFSSPAYVRGVCESRYKPYYAGVH